MTATLLLNAVRECDFQAQVQDLARLCGWRTYHTYDSRRSPEGYPDLCMVRSPRLVYAELKSERGKLTPAQLEWLAELREIAGVETYVFRPSDWDEIVELLR